MRLILQRAFESFVDIFGVFLIEQPHDNVLCQCSSRSRGVRLINALQSNRLVNIREIPRQWEVLNHDLISKLSMMCAFPKPNWEIPYLLGQCHSRRLFDMGTVP